MRPRLWKWVAWWGGLGLIVPLLLIVRWKLFGSMFGQLELILWPSSITLLGLEGPAPRSLGYVLLWYAVTVVTNAFVYGFVALLTWPIIRHLAKGRAAVG